MKPTYDELVDALLTDAETMERWAQESRAGGWSTHPVDANKRRVSEIRVMLSPLVRGRS